MSTNATETHRQKRHPNEVACPTWCARHQDVDAGTPDAFRVHRSRTRRTAGYQVQLQRVDDDQAGRTVVLLDDTELTAKQAQALAEVLQAAAGDAR
ncbi:hypothetical protein IN07_03305 [Modestobacter caceresii]|uniref:Uncharacterized protein n=1 Tax=Modestobacter caceresii TaxID=1522368 RepID=A0A098YBP4_9ACTN|nr:hypothetical protein [Modestobacter caceresii]KGH48243.1 hypothetical protein IN07_03305 [Modestobacter caceresii]